MRCGDHLRADPLTGSRARPQLPESAGESLARVLDSWADRDPRIDHLPGTTRDLLASTLETGSRVCRPGFSPRLFPGTDRSGPHRLHGPHHPETGRWSHPACTDKAVALYETICDRVIPLSGPEAAELSKLLENIFRSVNIALVSELAQLCDRLGVDVWEVIDAASTKPFGFMRFEPGPGMGGHCLPVDPSISPSKAREHDFTGFIELAGKINQSQPLFCVNRIERVLNANGKPVKGTKVLILGVSYKAGVGDTRESPAIKIIRLLG